MASVTSSTSSLSSTLQGYGGMASGIDRDFIIEQMTSGTQAKITKLEQQKTQLGWKQEAYQSLSDKLIDIQDNYMTYSSDFNIKNSSSFAQSIISAIGDSDYTKYISASGTSSLVNYLSILGVKQTASSATLMSEKREAGSIKTGNLSFDSDNKAVTSKLSGTKLVFGTNGTEDKFNTAFTFEFKSSYTDSNGDTVYIDYTTDDLQKLADDLNTYVSEANVQFDKGTFSYKTIEFDYDETKDQLTYRLVEKNVSDNQERADVSTKYSINATSSANALNALGFSSDERKAAVEEQVKAKYADEIANMPEDEQASYIEQKVSEELKKGITYEQYGTSVKESSKSYVTEYSMAGYLKNKSLTVSYGGKSIDIALITEEDLEKFAESKWAEYDEQTRQDRINSYVNDKCSGYVTEEYINNYIDEHLDAYIEDYVDYHWEEYVDNNAVDEGNADAVAAAKEGLRSEAKQAAQTALKTEAEDQARAKLEEDAVKAEKETLKDNYSIDDMVEAVQSRLDRAFGTGKVTVSEDGGVLEFSSADKQNLSVNSSDAQLRKILGIEQNQSNMLTKSASLAKNFGIDANDAADISINGVKLEGVTKDTTLAELIDLINDNDELGVKATYMESSGQLLLVAEDTGTGREITVSGEGADKIFGSYTKTEGQDAIMTISYGNGVTQEVVSSSNTFQLDGLSIAVSGTFGYDAAGQLDSSQSVRFEASADVDNVTENVKKFIEEYNALIDALYSETTTKPDSDYGVLTDDQKDEMSESEIEKWEKKAKEGLLYGDSTVRDLYSDLQALSTKILNSGISYEDLESIGITFSDSRADYGKLIFDETTFKEAMKSNSELVSNIFTGGGGVKTGLGQLVEDALTPYATRYATKNGNSYGKLIEEAGSSKLVLSTTDNYIYEQLKQMEEQIATMKARLETEQDRYIQQFTRMESAISTYNTQASYISGLTG